MIRDLNLVRRLRDVCEVKEFVVSETLFRQIVGRCRAKSPSAGCLRLNQPHDSPRWRYIHSAVWDGMTFIHLSDERWVDAPVLAEKPA